MCESLGYGVLSLKRVRIMNIKLDIPPGKYREFTKEELLELNLLLENSSKTFD
jgi:23S rRNA pseudouridine2604 synthase/16S rRNA pseudouridine516 synthase